MGERLIMYHHRRIEVMSGAEGDFKGGFPVRETFSFPVAGQVDGRRRLRLDPDKCRA